ncbi:MAG: hypothetical protein KIT84_09995 [Labilithrix sp.]|nr:hypothetical protein [Labilithrix sp.]MCW5811334.1 hypothetical protein [Labilithrix sp.]
MRAIGLALVLFAAFVAAACKDPETNFGEANSIVGRELPDEGTPSTSSGGSGTVEPSPPRLSMKEAHDGKAGAPAPGGKLDCLLCHKTGGTALAFTYGGQSTAGAVISIPGTDAVKADADGYFWLPGGDMPANSKVTSTKGGTSKTMSAALSPPTGGSCDAANCHGNADNPAI